VPFGERDRLAAAPLGRGERTGLRHVGTMEDIRESELRQAADFEVGAADLPGQVGTLPEVAYGVRQPQGPRLGGPQIPQCYRAQVAAQGNVFAGLPGYGGGQE